MISSVSILKIEQSDIESEFPKWVPINEALFKAYLIQHSERIRNNLTFIGYEINHTDLLFRSNDGLVVLEAKTIPADCVTPLPIIEAATRQLLRYCDQLQDVEPAIIPVLAFLYKGYAREGIDVSAVWSKLQGEYRTRSAHYKRLNHKIKVAQKKLNRLNKKVGRQLTELKEQKAELKDLKSQANLFLDNDLINALIQMRISRGTLRSIKRNYGGECFLYNSNGD